MKRNIRPIMLSTLTALGIILALFKDSRYMNQITISIGNFTDQTIALSSQITFNLRVLHPVFILLAIIFLLFFWKKNHYIKDKDMAYIDNKIKEMSAKIEAMIKFVHNGLKHTNNVTKITLNHTDKTYHFEFTKEFTVLTDSPPRWQKGQFYCNKYLEDNKKANEFYNEESPSWADLKMTAELQYKNPDDECFSDKHMLSIKNITDNSFYIPYYIYFSNTKVGQLPIQCGAKIILTYRYKVSAELWGSYINRHLGYYGEKCSIIFSHCSSLGNKANLELSKLKSDGEPELVAHDKYHINKRTTDDTDNEEQISYEIVIPPKSNAKYRLSWNSKGLLGIENSVNGIDESGLSIY